MICNRCSLAADLQLNYHHDDTLPEYIDFNGETYAVAKNVHRLGLILHKTCNGCDCQHAPAGSKVRERVLKLNIVELPF